MRDQGRKDYVTAAAFAVVAALLVAFANPANRIEQRADHAISDAGKLAAITLGAARHDIGDHRSIPRRA